MSEGISHCIIASLGACRFAGQRQRDEHLHVERRGSGPIFIQHSEEGKILKYYDDYYFKASRGFKADFNFKVNAA